MGNVVVHTALGVAEAAAKSALPTTRVRRLFHQVVGTIFLVSLFLMTAFVYESVDVSSSEKNIVCMVTLTMFFVVSRHCSFIYRFTTWIFMQPAIIVTGFIAISTLSSSSILRTIIEIYPTIFNTIIQSYGVQSIQLNMSSNIRMALCVISTIMIHIFSSLREKRTQITITFHMMHLSIGVIFYHIWMIEYVFFKWATAQPHSSQLLLSLNIGTYIIHAAYQMEFLFTYFKNGGMHVNSKWTSLNMTTLSILFNFSMIIHFVFIIVTCDSASCPRDYHLLVVVSLFEIVHRVLAIYVFGRLLLNCCRADSQEEVTLHRAVTEFAFKIPIFSQRDTTKSFMVSGLPPTTDHTGAMITGLVSSPPHHIPSHQDYDQPSEEMCYTTTIALQDTQPLPIPLPPVDGYCSIDMDAVCKPRPTIEDLWLGNCCS